MRSERSIQVTGFALGGKRDAHWLSTVVVGSRHWYSRDKVEITRDTERVG